MAKKRRILGGDGKGMAFRKPGEESDGESDFDPSRAADKEIGPSPSLDNLAQDETSIPIVPPAAIIIHDDD
jgi:hypothetical protein